MARRRGLAGLALALGAVAAALGLAELALRRWTPVEVTAFANAQEAGPDDPLNPRRGQFQLDPELGYRPVLDGPDYAAHGAVRNAYAVEKPAGVRRLLFLGDSVTRRATIQAGLEAELGHGGIEYWNGGVEGYATVQQVAYYRRHLAHLAPDHVVLTFHLNDFQTTPVTFLDGEKLVLVYAKRSTRELDPWLLEHSYLYRWVQTLGFERAELARAAIPAGVHAEIEAALTELRDLVRGQGGRLTVLVMPWLLPPAQWPLSHVRRHDWALETLTRLGIEHHEFRATVLAALEEGETIRETERDLQHPSAAFGLRMARALVAAGFRP